MCIWFYRCFLGLITLGWTYDVGGGGDDDG